MNTTIKIGNGLLLAALVLLITSSVALGATRTFNFDSGYGPPDENCLIGRVPPLFNYPEFGNQTKNYIVDPWGCGEGECNGTNGSESLLTQFYYSSSPYSNELRFSWDDTTDSDSWLRLIAFGASSVEPTSQSPTVHLGIGSSISMDILVFGTLGGEDIDCQPEATGGQLEFGLLIRETGLNLPLGEDGGTTGTLEFVGIDSIGGAVDPLSPNGGVPLTHSYNFINVTWDFVDAGGGVVGVQVSVDGGAPDPDATNIVGFTGDGILLADYDRGTLDGLAIRKPAGDLTSKKWFVNIDNIVIDAPGITDPVKVEGPVMESFTEVTVSTINSAATEVRLYEDDTVGGGKVQIASATAPPEDFSDGEHTFTGLTLKAGYELTATQFVDSIESGHSAPVTVLSAVVYQENFDGYADQAAYNAVWSKTNTGDTYDVILGTSESVSCPNSANEQAAPTGNSATARYVDFISVTGTQAWNGTDSLPLWLTYYFRHELHSNQRNFLQLHRYTSGTLAGGSLAKIYALGCYNAIAPTNEYAARDAFAGGPQWFTFTPGVLRKNNQWVKMQIKFTTSTVDYYIDDALAQSTTRFGTDGLTTLILGSDLSNAGAEAWYDNISLSLGANATDPFGPPLASPTVAGPLAPSLSPTTVTVTGINLTATLVNVYSDSTLIGSGNPAGADNMVVNVSSIPNNTVITATQVVGGAESCRSADQGVLAQVPAPDVESPINGGATEVTVSGILSTATLVQVYVDGVGVVGSGNPAGAATLLVTVSPALVDGQVVRATQTVDGFESPQTSPGVTVFTQGIGPLLISLGVREVAGLTGPVGATAGTGSGSIEWIGSTTTGSAPKGKQLTPGSGWQTIVFDPATDPIKGFTGNSALNSTSHPWYAFECLGITIDQTNPKAGPYTLYVDTIENAGYTFDYETFDVYPGTGNGAVMFRHPGFSGSTSTHLDIVSGPNSSIVTDEEANTGTKSLKVSWLWKDETLGRWLRYTTWTATYLPTPQLDLSQTVTVRLLLCGAPEVGVGNILAADGTTVIVTGVSPAADSVNVYANGSPIGTELGNGTDTVDVTVTALVSGEVITATQTIGGAEGCAGSGVTVGECSQIPGVGVDGPLVAGGTSVTVTGIDSNSILVTVYADGSPIGSVDPVGASSVAVTVTALVKGNVISATQTLSGLEGCIPSTGSAVGSGINSGLLLTLGIRENLTLTGPALSDGGTTGSSIEWLGAATTDGDAPVGTKQITPSWNWQLVTFDPSTDPVLAYTGWGGADGNLDGTYGVLEHLAISADPANLDTGPYVMYIDNVSSEGLTADFETYTAGQQVMFQEPLFSGSTDQNLQNAPDVSAIDDSYGDSSSKSVRVEFQFVDEGTDKWIRLTTNGAPDGRPNPQINLTLPITLKILLPPPVSCNDPFADADDDDDVDQDDFAIFQLCYTGPDQAIPVGANYCRCFDVNNAAGTGIPDNRIDEHDFGKFQLCASGPSVPADASCDD